MANNMPEILNWCPGASIAPSTIVKIDHFYGNDVGREDLPRGLYKGFSAILDTFAGNNDLLREDFKHRFSKYVDYILHPAVNQPSTYNTVLYDFLKPYDYAQEEFIDWLRQHTTKSDFVEPLARRFNEYRGNLVSPLLSTYSAINEDLLKKTNGHVAIYNEEEVILVSNNIYNPHRYMAPINQIHHREQPSLCYLTYSKQGKWSDTAGIINQFQSGDESVHLYLDYEIELSVEDFRETFNEWSAWSIYDVHPQDSQYLNGIMHWNAYFYGNGATGKDGWALSSVTQAAIRKYLETRLIPQSIEVSLMVNWLSNETYYRLSEWMIAGKDYLSSISYPDSSGLGFKPTVNDWLNPWIKEGGNNGKIAWHRHPINLLKTDIFNKFIPRYQPILHGGDYWEIPDGNSNLTLSGRIDLTQYYILSLSHTFFPGQRGYWVDREVGFEISNPDENHGIQWVGVIVENHSLHEVKVKIKELNVSTENI